jgi:hypothetical protein
MELVLDLGETHRSHKHRELLITVEGAIEAVIPGREQQGGSMPSVRPVGLSNKVLWRPCCQLSGCGRAPPSASDHPPASFADRQQIFLAAPAA